MSDPVAALSFAARFRMRPFVLFLILLAASPVAAQDGARGRELAVRWCASCHVVDRSATEARADGAPSFPSIAARPAVSADGVRAALSARHMRMPDFSLARRDQDDLIAYILELRK